MKNKVRVLVYSSLALPLLIFGIYAMSLGPLERSGFLADFKQNTFRLFSGDFRSVSPFSEDTQREAGGGFRGRSYSRYRPDAVFARLDKDEDGKLTETEMGIRLRDQLERVDEDQDGAMSLDEFRFGMQTAYSPK